MSSTASPPSATAPATEPPNTSAPTEKPKAEVLILHNEVADKDAYDLLIKHLRNLPARFYTFADATGKGDMQTWLNDMLQRCQVVLPLLSVDFFDDQNNPALPLLEDIVNRNNRNVYRGYQERTTRPIPVIRLSP